MKLNNYNYIKEFESLGFGLFVHFGLYSKIGQGEWYLDCNPNADKKKYNNLSKSFKIAKNWAKDLARTAKEAGCKYITLTTRHHDGFSLFDTCGLNEFDAPHSASKRDLIKEFVDACRLYDIEPFFYHTLLDWHHCDYENNFPKYIDYLIDSIEILCKNYGKIGGLWFDGMWHKPNDNWQEDRLYGIIRKYQPNAMIINNTGLSEAGKVGHAEIDSVTFERGNPSYVDNTDRPRAGEMCQVLNDHWGYARDDCNYKSVKELIENLVDCRKFGCNFLLNTGLLGNGSLNSIDKYLLLEVGKWVKRNHEFIYDCRPSNVKCDNAVILSGKDCYYALIKDVPMAANPNVQLKNNIKTVTVYDDIEKAEWIDGGNIEVKDNSFKVKPFSYGISAVVRIAKLKLKNS